MPIKLYAANTGDSIPQISRNQKLKVLLLQRAFERFGDRGFEVADRILYSLPDADAPLDFEEFLRQVERLLLLGARPPGN